MLLYPFGFLAIICIVAIQGTSYIAPSYEYQNPELEEDCCDELEKACDEGGWSPVLGYETPGNTATCRAYKNKECRAAEGCRREYSAKCLQGIQKIDGGSCGYCGYLPATTWCCEQYGKQFEERGDACKMAELQYQKNIQCVERPCGAPTPYLQPHPPPEREPEPGHSYDPPPENVPAPVPAPNPGDDLYSSYYYVRP